MKRYGCALQFALLALCALIWCAVAYGVYMLGSIAIEALIPEVDAAEVATLPKSSAGAGNISKRQRAETCMFPEKMQITDADFSTEEPQEDYENKLIEEALLARAHRIDDCRITYYCCERYSHICGTGDGITAAGTEVTPGISCAVPPGIPLGSTVIIDWGGGNLEYRRADDRGSWVLGDHIDLAVPKHREALNLGVKYATVYWCEEEL